jgi:hypothetical protein
MLTVRSPTDDSSSHRAELPKLTDDGVNNNYGEWKTKSYHKLHEWDLLKFIEGPDSILPEIPPLRELTQHHGLDEHNHLTTVRTLGNVIEHRVALQNAKPWLTGNNTTLSRIVAALPSTQLHLIQNIKYAKQAWDNLRSMYQSQNSLQAATIKGQIMAYCCTVDMNMAKWLNDMQCLYNSHCDLDIDRMSDQCFTLTILDLMPLDNNWHVFLSNLCTKANDFDAYLWTHVMGGI